MTSPNDLIRTLPKNFRPEDIKFDDLRHMAKDSFPMWCLTSGVQMDHRPIDFDKRRYLLPIYADDSDHIVWQKAAQLGATSYMLLRALWWLLNHQGRKAGLYFPTKEGVENLSSDRVTPLIQSCPDIAAIAREGDKLGLRKIGQSSFYLYHLGGVASKDSVPLDFITFDEVRLCKLQDIYQAMERISASEYGNRILMSTCGHPDDTINLLYQSGTQHVWHSKCFSGSTRIWVRHKETHAKSLKSFEELESCWQEYQALSVRTRHKKLTWRDITQFHNNGVQSTVSLRYKNGSTVECTPDHRFAWVSKKELTTVSYVEAKDILGTYRYGKYNRNNLLTVANVSTPGYDEPQVPFDNLTLMIVGAFVAEGSWKTPTSINLAQKEGKHLHQLVQKWAEHNNLTCNATEDGVDVSLASRRDLVSLFMECGRGCDNKQVPSSLLECSSRQAVFLLDGYLSGDGCRHELPTEIRHMYRGVSLCLDTAWEATTTSPRLVKDLAFLALKAGYPTSVRTNTVEEGKLPSWNISYHPHAVMKQDTLNNELYTTYITAVEDATMQTVYDITVDAEDDNDHNFVLENGAVVHNCGCPDGCDLARTFPECLVADDPRSPQPYYRCPKCKYVIRDPQNGRYVPMNPGASYTSYHVSQLVGKNKTTTPEYIWNMFKSTTNMQEFYNAKLGLPYIDEQNIGVTLGMLQSCVSEDLEWRKPNSKREKTRTCMGIDQGGGYCYVVIADVSPDGTKKRIRHLEIIESNNPDYYKDGKPVSPFVRCAELMHEFDVGLCVCDMMPNYNEALAFAKQFVGRVFLAWYQKDAKDAVAWNDRAKTKQPLMKAGTLKFKYTVALSRFNSMSFSLGELKTGDVLIPPPYKLVQMCRDEKTNVLGPESPAERFFNMLPRLVKRFHVTNEDTGEGRWEWIYNGGDPHFAHAWNYCTVGLERLRRATIYSFA